LKTLLDAQARLREVAEQTAAEAREQLERVAEALCPQVVDELRLADPLGLGQVTARALADDIIRNVRRRLSRLDRAEVAGRSADQQYGDARRELLRLREENARLEAELHEAQQLVQGRELKETVLQQSLEDAQRRLEVASEVAAPESVAPSAAPSPPTAATAVSPGQLPEWVQKWQQQKTYERDLALLLVLAETGVARRTKAAEKLASGLDLRTSRGGSISRLFQRCSDRLGLIEQIEVPTEVSGRATHLVRLTERGRDACRLLLRVEPAPSRTTELLKRHKSPAHALLNLEAGDLLRAAGYEVDLFPGQVELPDSRIFAPDLTASRHGRTLFVEVERETPKNLDQRNRKWRNYYDATGGEFYVVVPDRRALEKVRGEILFWASRKSLVLWMPVISEAKGKEGEAVWLFKRGEPR
jgi:hypothetical protein